MQEVGIQNGTCMVGWVWAGAGVWGAEQAGAALCCLEGTAASKTGRGKRAGRGRGLSA
jgi:hypothetical protein